MLPPGCDHVPSPAGRMILTAKRFVAPDPADLLERIDPDGTIVCLNPERELMQWPNYPIWLRVNQPERALWFSMPDWQAPGLDEALLLFTDLRDRLQAGGTVIVHCSHGQGRAGTTAVAALMMLGIDRGEAEATVAAHRPGAGPARSSQSSLISALDEFLQPPDPPR